MAFAGVLEDSVRLVRTPLSHSVKSNYHSTANDNDSPLTMGSHYSPTSSMVMASVFRMSSKYDLQHQPRQYFFYISVLCMLYCVLYRLFLYYSLYQQSRVVLATQHWLIELNALVAIISLGILLFLTALITLIRISGLCSPKNVQIFIFALLRLCIIFVLHLVVIAFSDSFILFTFISYVFSPSASSDSQHVDIFWQSVRKYLKDADDDDATDVVQTPRTPIQQQQQQEQDALMMDDDDNHSVNHSDYAAYYSQRSLHTAAHREKLRRLITIHYYCMHLYLNQTKLYANKGNYNAGIFGRGQQQIAIQRLRPIVHNEYHQRQQFHPRQFPHHRFGISTPHSLSSVQRRTSHATAATTTTPMLQPNDLQIWFSVVLWMPVFLNDSRYRFYWVLEKLLLRIALLALLCLMVYSETSAAAYFAVLPIPTIIRCVLETVNLLNVVPFLIYDDPEFDNIAELYSSRELSTAVGKKRRIDIIHDINKTYHAYFKNLTQQQRSNQNMHNNINNAAPAQIQPYMLPSAVPRARAPNRLQNIQSFDITPACSPVVPQLTMMNAASGTASVVSKKQGPPHTKQFDIDEDDDTEYSEEDADEEMESVNDVKLAPLRPVARSESV